MFESLSEKLNKTLEILASLKCRSIFRINLIKDFNMSEKNIKEFAKMINQSSPLFVELKGYMAIGYARKRIGYEKMPWHEDVLDFAKKLATATKLKILDEHYYSRAVVLGCAEDAWSFILLLLYLSEARSFPDVC